MQVCDIVNQLNLKVFSGEQGLNTNVNGAYTSDLLSDVVGNIDEGNIWITLQTHNNIMAVGSLKDVAAIILVKGLEPESATINQSNKEGIPILGTDKETFEISGELYQLLKRCNYSVPQPP